MKKKQLEVKKQKILSTYKPFQKGENNNTPGQKERDHPAKMKGNTWSHLTFKWNPRCRADERVEVQAVRTRGVRCYGKIEATDFLFSRREQETRGADHRKQVKHKGNHKCPKWHTKFELVENCSACVNLLPWMMT